MIELQIMTQCLLHKLLKIKNTVFNPFLLNKINIYLIKYQIYSRAAFICFYFSKRLCERYRNVNQPFFANRSAAISKLQGILNYGKRRKRISRIDLRILRHSTKIMKHKKHRIIRTKTQESVGSLYLNLKCGKTTENYFSFRHYYLKVSCRILCRSRTMVDLNNI